MDRLIAMLDRLEGDPDLEPSFGTGLGGPDAFEAEGDYSDDEQSLGWAASVGQARLDGSTDDGDETALERYGRGFLRSGPDDAEDSDPGEDNADHEASLASPERYSSQTGGASGSTADLEDDHDGREPDEDGEPSLGALTYPVGRGSRSGADGDQTEWGSGGSKPDLESDGLERGELDESDAEPSMGATHSEDQEQAWKIDPSYSYVYSGGFSEPEASLGWSELGNQEKLTVGSDDGRELDDDLEPDVDDEPDVDGEPNGLCSGGAWI